MVGVPGRSRGCHTCKKRKIACSQERPECFLCKKSGRKCLGYERERIFVYDGQYVPKRRQKQPETPATQSESVSEGPCTQNGSLDEVKQMQEPFCVLDVSRSNSLMAATSQQQVLGLVLCKYQSQSRYDPLIDGNWMTVIPELPSMSPALEAAALAFCSAKLGRQANDTRLVKHSLQSYTRGLYELQKALWDPHSMYDDHTLGACVLLTMYEVFECPGKNTNAYVSHHDGCARLIQARGPSAHTSGMGHSIFVSFRFIGALQALVNKTTFLAEPIWKSIPFSEVGKTHFSLLMDLLLEAPPYLAQGEDVKVMPSSKLRLWTALDLIKSCRSLESKLRTFHANFEASSTTRLYWETKTPVSGSSLFDKLHGQLFSVSFQFMDVRIAGIMMLYWAMMTILLSGISSLHYLVVELRDTKVCQTDEVPNAPNFDIGNGVIDPLELPPLGQADDFRHMGGNVLKCVPYCLDSVSRDLGLSAVIAPLQMVKDIFKSWPGCEMEYQCALAALMRVSQRGVGIVEHQL